MIKLFTHREILEIKQKHLLTRLLAHEAFLDKIILSNDKIINPANQLRHCSRRKH
jgi:hypothetical protein